MSAKSQPEGPAGVELVPPPWSAPLASLARRGPDAVELERLSAKVLEGGRLAPEEGLFLHQRADLLTLGRLADEVRRRLNPEPRVTYIIDRNVNTTAACVAGCGFCAFSRPPGHEEAWLLSHEQLLEEIQEVAEMDGRQVLIQGGHHPKLGSDWWCELLAEMRRRFPKVNPHGLSAPELDHLSRMEKRPVEEVLDELVRAGLGSVPGAGAEILSDRVRRILSPNKCSGERWLEVHRRVHEAGLRSSATMVFGHLETVEERIDHLDRLRGLQDETGGFTAFICWNMQPQGVPAADRLPPKATAAAYLRVQALARLYLDNVPHMQTSFVTQGMKIAQLSLRFGCDDFGGTMMEEKVVSAAGCFHLKPVGVVERMIERAGFRPLRRNTWYGVVDERFEAPPGDPRRGPRTREEAAR